MGIVIKIEKAKKIYYRHKTAIRWVFLNSIITPMYSKHLRAFVLRKMGSKIAKGVSIYRNCYIWEGSNIQIDIGSTVGFKVHLDDRKGM
jgi:hypothetical protein